MLKSKKVRIFLLCILSVAVLVLAGQARSGPLVINEFMAANGSFVPDPQGEYEGTYSGRYNVIEGPGLVVHGRDLVSLDGMLLELTKETINNVPSVNQAPIDLAEQEINPIDQSAIVQAKARVGNWFSYLPQAAS